MPRRSHHTATCVHRLTARASTALRTMQRDSTSIELALDYRAFPTPRAPNQSYRETSTSFFGDHFASELDVVMISTPHSDHRFSRSFRRNNLLQSTIDHRGSWDFEQSCPLTWENPHPYQLRKWILDHSELHLERKP